LKGKKIDMAAQQGIRSFKQGTKNGGTKNGETKNGGAAASPFLARPLLAPGESPGMSAVLRVREMHA
jgi:hypothetical protein